MKSERDERFTNIRPNLSTSESEGEDSSVLNFQNQVLRPILKLQNSIVLAQFREYIKKFKPSFNAYNLKVQQNYVSDVMKSDPRIRNSLIASVVSVMTLEEYNFYVKNKNECNKRIVTLLIRRIQDHLEMLY
jgi:hypothetical protein